MYNIVTGIEFWINLIVNFLIVELLKFKPMNIIKSIFVGVEAMVWGHNIVTCEILCKETTYQDDSDGGSIPPPHSPYF